MPIGRQRCGFAVGMRGRRAEALGRRGATRTTRRRTTAGSAAGGRAPRRGAGMTFDTFGGTRAREFASMRVALTIFGCCGGRPEATSSTRSPATRSSPNNPNLNFRPRPPDRAPALPHPTDARAGRSRVIIYQKVGAQSPARVTRKSPRVPPNQPTSETVEFYKPDPPCEISLLHIIPRRAPPSYFCCFFLEKERGSAPRGTPLI